MYSLGCLDQSSDLVWAGQGLDKRSKPPPEKHGITWKILKKDKHNPEGLGRTVQTHRSFEGISGHKGAEINMGNIIGDPSPKSWNYQWLQCL